MTLLGSGDVIVIERRYWDRETLLGSRDLLGSSDIIGIRWRYWKLMMLSETDDSNCKIMKKIKVCAAEGVRRILYGL